MKLLLISGAGFIAGHRAYNALIDKLLKEGSFEQDSDYPEIILHHFPFSGIDNDGKMNNMLKQELIQLKAKHKNYDYIMFYCNTLHTSPLLKYLFKDKLISLIDETKDYLFKNNLNNKSTLVLSSLTINKKKFFGKELSYIHNRFQEDINRVIELTIENNILELESIKKKFNNELLKYCKKENITTILLGCTELSNNGIIDIRRINKKDIQVIDNCDIVNNKILNIII